MTIPPIKPVYGVYDFDGQLVLPPGPQPPTAPIEGSMYASGGFVYVWHGSEWVEIGADSGGGGSVVLVQPEPPDPTGLPEGTQWVDEDSDVPPFIASTAGHTVQDEGTPLATRAGLNFAGAGVTATDDAASNRTNVTIPNPLPTGGTTDQVLTKSSATDYALKWATPVAGGGLPIAAADGRMLIARSDTLTISYSSAGFNGLVHYLRGMSATPTASQNTGAGIVQGTPANALDENSSTVAQEYGAGGIASRVLWWQMDIGAGNTIIPTYHTIQGNPAGDWASLNAWDLLGSNDGSTWTTLKAVTATPLTGGSWGGAAVTGSLAYRYFRVLHVSDIDAYGNLAIASFEIYGTLIGSLTGTAAWVQESFNTNADARVALNGPKILVLGPTDPVPPGTPAGTIIVTRST